MTTTNPLAPVAEGSLAMTPELATRIAAVEQVMLADFGVHHVPDAYDRLRYFPNEADARVERRREAERRIRQIDYRKAQLQARIEATRAALLDPVRIPTPREMARMQQEQFERDGYVTVTGYESVEEAMRR